MTNKFEKTLVFLILATALIIVVSSVALLPTVKAPTSQESSTTSTASVNTWIEFAMSANLTAGILFGSVDPNTNDNAASGNVGGGVSLYSVTAGAANNVGMDLCIKDDQNLTKSGDTIPNVGYTYDWDALPTAPALPGTAINTSYTRTDHTNILAGAASYSKYWLDIPTAQPSGAYTNTVYIKGVQTTTAC